jgi:hypothetical protein
MTLHQPVERKPVLQPEPARRLRDVAGAERFWVAPRVPGPKPAFPRAYFGPGGEVTSVDLDGAMRARLIRFP